MIKMFEEYELSDDNFIRIFMKRLYDFFDDYDDYDFITNDEDYISFDDRKGKNYFDFVFDSYNDLLDNFFFNMEDSKDTTISGHWSDDEKEKIIQEYNDLYDKLMKFVNEYYSKEYNDYLKAKTIKKFKI